MPLGAGRRQGHEHRGIEPKPSLDYPLSIALPTSPTTLDACHYCSYDEPLPPSSRLSLCKLYACLKPPREAPASLTSAII